MTKTKTTIIFYQPDEDIFKNLDIPVQLIPVREKNQKKVFKKKKVNLALLVDEIFYFLSEAPEYINQYREMVGKLTYNLGVEAGNKKQHKKAAEFFKKGLILNPQNASLWVNYAQALYTLGQKEDAILAYLKVVEHPEIPTDPILWTCIARLLFDEAQYKMAYQLLKEAGAIVPKEDQSFWKFYRLVRDKAGEEEIKDVENLEEILSEAVSKVSKSQNDNSVFYGEDIFGEMGTPEPWEEELDDEFSYNDSKELDVKDPKPNICPSCGAKFKFGV